jgi:hypothetical protein
MKLLFLTHPSMYASITLSPTLNHGAIPVSPSFFDFQYPIFYQEKGKHQLSKLDSIASHHRIKNKQNQKGEKTKRQESPHLVVEQKPHLSCVKYNTRPAHKGGQLQPLGKIS